MKTKNGISLIVLVLTVIVLAILAGAVIITLNNTNVIGEAKNATFKSDMAGFKEAYELYLTGKLLENHSYDKSTLDVTYGTDTFKEIFGENVPEKYSGLKISKGQLQYKGTTEEEKAILESLNISDGIIKVVADGAYILSVFGTEYQIDENTTWQDIINSEVPVTVTMEDFDYYGTSYKTFVINGKHTTGYSDVSNTNGNLNSHMEYGGVVSNLSLTTKIMSMDGTTCELYDGKISQTLSISSLSEACSDLAGWQFATIRTNIEAIECIGIQNVMYVYTK